MLETHCFQWISKVFDNLFNMLLNKNGSTNMLRESYYANLKKEENHFQGKKVMGTF